MTDTTEDGESTASPPKRLPYVAPFLRHLDLEDSEGKTSGDPNEFGPTFGPS
jgi:hypothetical protein